jgi:hypothetical protein
MLKSELPVAGCCLGPPRASSQMFLLTPSGFTACDFWVPSKFLEGEQASASSVISLKS